MADVGVRQVGFAGQLVGFTGICCALGRVPRPARTALLGGGVHDLVDRFPRLPAIRDGLLLLAAGVLFGAGPLR